MGKRLIELDGLRGFAALTVVISHYLGEAAGGLRPFYIGWLGVNVFFVLSGFLIGGIIFDQCNEPGFFRSFYFRRVTRIVPIYFLIFLSVILLAHLTAGHSWSDHPFSPTTYATFTVNFAESFRGLGSVWLRPAWTLSVEEQFYLILPILIVFLPKRYLLPTMITGWFVALLCRVLLIDINATAAWDMLPCRMDLLLAGVTLAYTFRRIDLSKYVLGLRVGWAVSIVLMNLLAIFCARKFVVISMGSLTSIGIACFMLAAFYNAPEGRWVRAAWLRWFGQISYCLYLVHQPVNGLLHGLLLNESARIDSIRSATVTFLAFGCSVGLAAASWRWFEKPILDWAAQKNTDFLKRARIGNGLAGYPNVAA